MVNVDLLRSTIESSGLKVAYIAEKCGILRETLYNRFNSPGDFKISEISALTAVLGLDRQTRDRIFFASERECNSREDEG